MYSSTVVNFSCIDIAEWRLVRTRPTFDLPQLVSTKGKDEVPLLFREPHVEQGFRELHQPWLYYILSVFQLHNESMNVWTHLLALVLMASRLLFFWDQLDFVNDAYTWPLLAGLICGLALYACSSGAHCLQSKSELVHYTAFMVDYAGIGLYGLGSVILHLMYCSEDDFYFQVKDFFVPLGGVLAFAICYCCSVAKVIYCRPYPFRRKIWQIGPVCCIYVVLISPIAHRLQACFVYGQDCNESIPYHIRQMCWFLASGLFFASDVPQRFFPGRCDHFFHSHQIFHICIMICTLQQWDGVFIDYQTRKEVIMNRQQPTLATAFGPVLIVILMEFLCILYFWIKIKHKLQQHK